MVLVAPNKEDVTKPVGWIFENEPNWDEIDFEKWNPRLKMYEWDHSETDHEHYIEFIDGHFVKFDKNTCRNCHKTITPYKTKYYQHIWENGEWRSDLYAEKNCYCEKCAKEITSMRKSIKTVPEIVKREQREEFGSGEYLECVTYEDGSSVSEMNWDEKVRAGLI